MASENFSKKKTIGLIISLIVLVLGVAILLYYPTIFQEGNPCPQFKGIAQLSFSNKQIVELGADSNKYLTKSDDPEIIKSFMKDKGYDFIEQMGAAYLFISPAGGRTVVNHRYYSRYYSLWLITENKNVPSNLENNPAETSPIVHDDSWATLTNDNGITYQYPDKLSTKYIDVAEWPPVIKIERGIYSCAVTPPERSDVASTTSQTLVSNRNYCVISENEGAAGSVYSSYVYTTVRGDELIHVSFTLRYTSCYNYDEPQMQECTQERETFNVDPIIDKIVQTIK